MSDERLASERRVGFGQGARVSGSTVRVPDNTVQVLGSFGLGCEIH